MTRTGSEPLMFRTRGHQCGGERDRAGKWLEGGKEGGGGGGGTSGRRCVTGKRDLAPPKQVNTPVSRMTIKKREKQK